MTSSARGAARLSANATDFAKASISLFPVLVLLRVYEIVIARAAHPLPAGTGLLVLRGLRSDVGLVFWSALLFVVPVLALGQIAPRAGRALHRILLALLVSLGVLLAQYFSVTLVPLGSDLFGYSMSDIRETAGASKGVGFGAVVSLLFFAALAVVCAWRSRRFSLPRAGTIAFFVLVVFAGAAHALFTPALGAFASDAEFFVADNKTVYFADRSLDYFAGRRGRRRESNSLTGFPLLHKASNDDVLGPLLTTAGTKPNLVFVIVEGLGRDFVGPGARYGGFTPFLDSLTGRSLYWENFLSSSGRTFSILPSLFASAPYGQTGFMELGDKMPPHISLVTLLKERGYRTEYFTGTQGHFDNIDVFMRREGVDRFVDQSNFGVNYQKEPAAPGGQSWGYADHDLFKHSLEIIGAPNNQPRLDVYLTITTHEPFIAPRVAEYDARFEQRLAALPIDESRKSVYRDNEIVFRTLIYLDDAVRSFITAYSARADFAHTIFFITGDHRLIPVPEVGRLDRYHVPLIVYSPMVKTPRTMSSVSSHIDVTPSVLAYLARGYGMSFPDSVSWLGTGLDTAVAFRNVHSIAFMRTKNTLEDYLSDDAFLSGNDLFRVKDSLRLDPISDRSVRNALFAKLDQFKELNNFTTSGNHLYPAAAAVTRLAKNPAADSAFAKLEPSDTAPDRAFQVARQRAFSGDYAGARLLARHLLDNSPNDHDSETLIARTFAWQKQYDSARVVLDDLVKRAPEYADASAALIDVELWSGHAQTALRTANAALSGSPLQADLLFGKAKALEQLSRSKEALAVLDTLQKVSPQYSGASDVRKRLKPR